MSQKRTITTFLSRKFMITRSSIAFEDLLAPSTASQVMPSKSRTKWLEFNKSKWPNVIWQMVSCYSCLTKFPKYFLLKWSFSFMIRKKKDSQVFKKSWVKIGPDRYSHSLSDISNSFYSDLRYEWFLCSGWNWLLIIE